MTTAIATTVAPKPSRSAFSSPILVPERRISSTRTDLLAGKQGSMNWRKRSGSPRRLPVPPNTNALRLRKASQTYHAVSDRKPPGCRSEDRKLGNDRPNFGIGSQQPAQPDAQRLRRAGNSALARGTCRYSFEWRPFGIEKVAIAKRRQQSRKNAQNIRHRRESAADAWGDWAALSFFSLALQHSRTNTTARARANWRLFRRSPEVWFCRMIRASSASDQLSM